jgi:hypothetical protein
MLVNIIAARRLACLPVFLAGFGAAVWAQDKSPRHAVTVVEDASAYVLSNGAVSARVDKKSGDLLSVRFKEMEMLSTIFGPDGLPDVAIDKPGSGLKATRENAIVRTLSPEGGSIEIAPHGIGTHLFVAVRDEVGEVHEGGVLFFGQVHSPYLPAEIW